MSPELAQLLQQRASLQKIATQQRASFTHTAQHWQKPLALADQGLKGIRWLHAHPIAVLGIAAVIGLRRGGVGSLVMGIWRGWQWYRRAKVLLNGAINTLR